MHNCILFMLLFVCLVSGRIFAADGDLGGSGRDGSEDRPYLIEDFDDFEVFCCDANYWACGVCVRLDCDLDLDPNLEGRMVYCQAPIAGDIDWDYSFDGIAYAGNFDGDGHVISNLVVEGEYYCGLFGMTDRCGSITGVGLENALVIGLANHVGALVSRNYCSIISSYSTGRVFGDSEIGGLAGGNFADIISSYSTCEVNGEGDYVGGFVGYSESGNISESFATGCVYGNHYVGGLVGYNRSGRISKSFASGGISSSGYYVGGLIGYNDTGGISESFASGEVVTDDGCAGGLAGENNCVITNSYSLGGVEGNFYVGGLVGRNKLGIISDSFAVGEVVTNDVCVGGLAAENTGSIVSCFWDVEISCMDIAYTQVSGSFPDIYYTPIYSTVGFAEGRTTLEMQTASTFTGAGWDFVGGSINGFDDVWRMCKDWVSYPKLGWEFDREGDITCGDGVDLDDLAVLMYNWLSDDGEPNFYRLADISLDGFVDMRDFAVIADNWLRGTTYMVWVNVDNDAGFDGQMSKYEITNGQYCEFLNEALGSGDVFVDGSYVRGDNGENSGDDFYGQRYYDLSGAGFTYNGATDGGAARINYVNGVFVVESGFDMHPVTYVSWYGAKAFCNYYGYRLPTESEWQTVADYNGSYAWGCGYVINTRVANIFNSVHPDGTVEVGSFGDPDGYGYGVCDLTGNVWEWTDSWYSDEENYRVLKGASWDNSSYYCFVYHRHYKAASAVSSDMGFRVCR